MKKFLIVLLISCGMAFAQSNIWLAFGFDSYVSKVGTQSGQSQQSIQTTIPYISLIWNANFMSVRIKGGITNTNLQSDELQNTSSNTASYFGVEVRIKIFDEGTKKNNKPKKSRH